MNLPRLGFVFLVFTCLFGTLPSCAATDSVEVAPDVVEQETKTSILKELAAESPESEIVSTVDAVGLELPTPTPFPSSTPTPVPTPSPMPTPTTVIWPISEVIGYSSDNQALVAFQFGSGPRWFVAVGAIHGAHECNTYQLLDAIVKRLKVEPALLPEDVTLFVVPLVNPYGCDMYVRTNSRGVDLNRNWYTDDWVADSEGPSGVVTGAGGAFPFSEMETSVLSSWLLKLRDLPHDGPLNVISYHSLVTPNGLVQPGYREKGNPDPKAQELAEAYSEASGYQYSSYWVGNYSITGELIHWAADYNIVAIDVELPDGNAADTIPAGRSETHIVTNLQSLLAVMGN